jgi:hypothetical protein
MIDQDRPCPHENFAAQVDVNRLTRGEDGPINGFVADVRIQCADCDEVFRFMGVEAGHMPDRPMVSVDEKEIHLPIRPATSDPDFGLGIPGYAIRQVR